MVLYQTDEVALKKVQGKDQLEHSQSLDTRPSQNVKFQIAKN